MPKRVVLQQDAITANLVFPFRIPAIAGYNCFKVHKSPHSSIQATSLGIVHVHDRKTLAHYEITSQLGKGGMSEVY